MEGMIVSFINKVLGQIIYTCTLNVGIPQVYMAKTLWVVRPFHTKWKSFTLDDMETTSVMLIHIAGLVPWLCFMFSQVYISIAAALRDNTSHLHRTSK